MLTRRVTSHLIRGRTGRSRPVFWVLALIGFLAMPMPLLASPVAVHLVDVIAPGRFAGNLGLGPGPVAVAANGEVTYLVAVSPPLPGESVEIWTRRSGMDWQRTRSARIARDGSARTFLHVAGDVTFQARLVATSTHAAAVSQGRRAGVDTAGRSIIRVTCAEVAALRAGSIAARSAGMAVGSTLSVELCGSGATWSVADADPLSLFVRHWPVSAGTTNDRFDVRLLHPGSRTIRLVERGSGTGQRPRRTILVMVGTAPLAVRITRNVPLTPLVPCGSRGTCQVQADVVAPQTGGPWPVVVFLRGGPGGPGARSVYEPFAIRLASDGVLVYNADYRDNPAFGSQYPRAFDDAACAVRVARATATKYSGRSGAVTLVGHSLGAYVGSIVALSANAFASSCLATGIGAPNMFVGISGPYRLDPANLQNDFVSVLGGTRAQVPYAWRNGDPFAWVGRRQGVSFRLIHGAEDPTVDAGASDALESALLAAGFDTALTTVSFGSHVSVIGDTKGGEWAVAVILAALR